MDEPTNLTALALDDYDAVLTESLRWGSANAANMRHLLTQYFADIRDHRALGRKRDDIPFRVVTHSIRAGRTPYLIFYRPAEGLVVWIVHGKRDLPALFDAAPV